jgi:hypothetical protein
MYLWRTTRETKEGWPLLTVETEVNGDSKSTNERGPSLVGSLGLLARYKRFFSAFADLISQEPEFMETSSLRTLKIMPGNLNGKCKFMNSASVQNNFSLAVNYFNSFVPSPSKLGR